MDDYFQMTTLDVKNLEQNLITCNTPLENQFINLDTTSKADWKGVNLLYSVRYDSEADMLLIENRRYYKAFIKNDKVQIFSNIN